MAPFNFKGRVKISGNAVFKRLIKSSISSINFIKASINNKTIFTNKISDIVIENQSLFPYVDEHNWKLAHQFEIPNYLNEQYFYQDSNLTVPALEIGDPIGGVKSLNNTINLAQPSAANRPILNDGYFLFNGTSHYFQAGVNTDWNFLHQVNTGVTILVKVEDDAIGTSDLSAYIGTTATSRRIGMFFVYENRGGQNALRLFVVSGAGNVNSLSPNIGNLSAGSHVFGTVYTKSKVSFYIDGQKISEQSLAPGTIGNSSAITPSPLEIGKIAGYSSLLFKGKFYNLFVADEDLTDAEVESISNSMMETTNT